MGIRTYKAKNREFSGEWNAWYGGGQKEETYNKYGDAARKVEIGAIENMGHFCESLFGGTGRRILNWRGVRVRRKNKSNFGRPYQKQAPALGEIGN